VTGLPPGPARPAARPSKGKRPPAAHVPRRRALLFRESVRPDLDPLVDQLQIRGPAGFPWWAWSCTACGASVEDKTRRAAAVAAFLHRRRCA
jgi:hypothetical protein